MKIELPSSKQIIKSVIIGLILSIIGFVLFPYLNLTAFALTNPALLVTYSVLISSIIAGILVVIPMEFNLLGSNEVSVFVGNLAFKAGAGDLRELFEEYGDVQGVRVMTDRATRRPKGFAFIEMDKKGAKAAIADLDGSEFFDRDIKVNFATRRKRSS